MDNFEQLDSDKVAVATRHLKQALATLNDCIREGNKNGIVFMPKLCPVSGRLQDGVTGIDADVALVLFGTRSNL